MAVPEPQILVLWQNRNQVSSRFRFCDRTGTGTKTGTNWNFYFQNVIDRGVARGYKGNVPLPRNPVKFQRIRIKQRVIQQN